MGLWYALVCNGVCEEAAALWVCFVCAYGSLAGLP